MLLRGRQRLFEIRAISDIGHESGSRHPCTPEPVDHGRELRFASRHERHVEAALLGELRTDGEPELRPGPHDHNGRHSSSSNSESACPGAVIAVADPDPGPAPDRPMVDLAVDLLLIIVPRLS